MKIVDRLMKSEISLWLIAAVMAAILLSYSIDYSFPRVFAGIVGLRLSLGLLFKNFESLVRKNVGTI